MPRVQIKRQKAVGVQWGIYVDGVLREGGFSCRAAAEEWLHCNAEDFFAGA